MAGQTCTMNLTSKPRCTCSGLQGHPWRPQALHARPSSRPTPLRGVKRRRQQVQAAAAPEETEIKLGRGRASSQPREDGFQVACAPEDLPKGERKALTIGGVQILLFWYRNSIIAIEPRSPAEGAYSEGFIGAKLTQDNCIECPSTSSLFDLTTGEIKAWYPKNPVLRLLTPQDTARNMIVYPVKLESDSILVNVGTIDGPSLAGTRGGAGTSSAGNNIYALQPQTYVQGSTVGTDQSPSTGTPDKLDNFTVGVAALGFGVTAITGTTIALSNKSYSGLAVFWAVLSVLLGLFAIRYFAPDDQARIDEINKKL